MAGIYSQGGSAGHRYAGWLSKVEAKNFHFGGKVFNGSPSAIYVGSKKVWANWLKDATQRAIMAAFGVDGTAVIVATNEYLNGIAASDKAKATALAGLMNSSATYACGFGELFWKYSWVEYIRSNANQVINTGLPATNFYLGGIRAKYRHVTYPGSYPVLAGVRQDYYLNFGGLHGQNAQFYTRYETSGTIKTYNAPEFNLTNFLMAETLLEARNKNFTLTINGVTKTWTYNNFMRNDSTNLTIFAINTSRSFACAADLMEFEVYGNNNDVIAMYIPCYRKSDNVIGLFDVVRRRFDINSGTGEFGKGNDLVSPPQTP